MRNTDVFGRLFHRHVLVVDIVRPYIADPLLTFQVILCHSFQCDRGVFEVFDLPLVGLPTLVPGVDHNEAQYGGNNDHIDQNNNDLSHVL